jgi:uncharacterized protein YchJ
MKILFFSWSLTSIATVFVGAFVGGTCWIPTVPTTALSSQRPTWAFQRQRRRGALCGIEAKRSSSSSSSSSSSPSSLKKQQQQQPFKSDVLNRIHCKNRLPVDIDTTTDACPCGGLGRSDLLARPYRECCAKFHDAAVFYLEQQLDTNLPSNASSLCWPDSPRQLLASRYTAFFYRWPAYIMATTHESSRDYRPPAQYMDWCLALDRDGMFDALDFVSLRLEDEEEGDEDANEAYISFVVTLQEKQKAKRPANKAGFAKVAATTPPPPRAVEIWERSHFLRDATGRWKYASGQVRTGSGGSGSVLLNA